jgi:predicted ATP-dependent endonuclease of OLD family
MHLHSYRIRNYRRLRDVHIELAADISIFVGANNSGKTSATQALQMFLTGQKFSPFDFSSHTWNELNAIGAAPVAGDVNANIPAISLDLWFEVAESDLYLVLPILPSSDWQGTLVGVRVEFGARNVPETLRKFRAKRAEAQQRTAALAGGAGAYLPWPKTLTDFLEKELHEEFELRYFVLDRAQFNDAFKQNQGYAPVPITGEPTGGAILKSLVRVDCLNAQRHLGDPGSGTTVGAGRAEDLSKCLSRFYRRNLDQRGEDDVALKALFESEDGLNKHLMKVFAPTLKRIAKLGYPGLNNPRLEIKSELNPATVLNKDARVHYVLGDGENAVTLPDSYNGLGFKNLIYMVVEILDLQEHWRTEEPGRAPLHLIFVEEPEAHLHAQLQQVFIRNVLNLLEIPGEQNSPFRSQMVTTSHSPHILYERGFKPIRYFRRHVVDGHQSTTVLNLSRFQIGADPKDRDFLQRYLKLTHCDLFFADAAILVEGNVERLLLPLMIEREAESLRAASLSILEVCGAFGYRFKELIEFLGITTLVITDVDSVKAVVAPVALDEDEEKEFEVPGHGENAPAQKCYGSTCIASTPDAVTANQTLIQWLPKKRTLTELFAVTEEEKIQLLHGSESAKVRIAYQMPRTVAWAANTASLCGRTLEESFGLENAEWCQHPDRQPVGLKLRTVPADPNALAAGLHKRVTGKNFDKTRFALGVLSRKAEDWAVPFYIKEGLSWLAEQVDLEVKQEAEAVADAVTDGAVAALAQGGGAA